MQCPPPFYSDNIPSKHRLIPAVVLAISFCPLPYNHNRAHLASALGVEDQANNKPAHVSRATEASRAKITDP
jgi:hypothetical protein